MPSYLGTDADSGHRQAALDAIVLANLGTPAAPTPGALRRYLAQFLSDPRVIELPRWLWYPILYGPILTFRPFRSARAYRSVWTEQGSPLLVLNRRLAEGVDATLKREFGARAPEVHLAMSYGEPGLGSVLEALRQRGLRRLLVLPLYPQYSATTTGAVFDAVADQFKRWRRLPELRFLTEYYRHPDYIAALAASVRRHWQEKGRGDRLLLSFHGIPRRYLTNGDPYFCHCHVTARLLAEALELPAEAVAVSFQSRVGREVWLQPYTAELLAEWGKAKAGRVQVLCPGFAVDCLETLEEIAVENRDNFLEHGGERFEYIPALNAEPDHAALLAALVRRHMSGWPVDHAAPAPAQRDAMLAERARRHAELEPEFRR